MTNGEEKEDAFPQALKKTQNFVSNGLENPGRTNSGPCILTSVKLIEESIISMRPYFNIFLSDSHYKKNTFSI